MTSIDQKRRFVHDLYSGPNWKKRVNKMTDEQVVAIYLSKMNGEDIPEPRSEAEIAEDEQTVLLDVLSIPGPGPHHNEDDFHSY